MLSVYSLKIAKILLGHNVGQVAHKSLDVNVSHIRFVRFIYSYNLLLFIIIFLR